MRCNRSIGAAAALFGLLTSLAGCQAPGVRDTFVRPLEKAHHLAKWRQTEALAMDITLTWGANDPLPLQFLFETNGAQVRMTAPDGATIIHDGSDAWISPASAEFPQARFHVLTWPWFLMQPFKLGGDAETRASELRQLGGVPHETAYLTYPAGSGDSPDDWYILYQDPETRRLAAAAYIVTYGKTLAEANADPHVIIYRDYRKVSGVWLSHHWVFQPWRWDRGILDEQLGTATISDVKFVQPPADAFTVPDDARPLPLPSADDD